MLLPNLVSQAINIEISIGFFLHIPFPSSEIFKYTFIAKYIRLLPYKEEVLSGLLACKVVGFHIYDYSRHFISACEKILNCKTRPDMVLVNNRAVVVSAIPIGIESQLLLNVLT